MYSDARFLISCLKRVTEISHRVTVWYMGCSPGYHIPSLIEICSNRFPHINIRYILVDILPINIDVVMDRTER